MTMSSTEQIKKCGLRYKFLSKTSLTGSSDPLMASDGQEISSKIDYSQCEASSDKVERGETKKKVWKLQNLPNRSNLEALISSSTCIVEVGEGEDLIQLRFFLKSEVTNMSWFEKDRIKKHLSLWCGVLKGGEGKQLAFAVKVDKLSDNLQFEQTLVTEKAVIINSEKDREEYLICSVLLPYLTAQIRGNGQLYNMEYRFESLKELCFGFCVTQLQCSGDGRYGEQGSVHSRLVSYKTT